MCFYRLSIEGVVCPLCGFDLKKKKKLLICKINKDFNEDKVVFLGIYPGGVNEIHKGGAVIFLMINRKIRNLKITFEDTLQKL